MTTPAVPRTIRAVTTASVALVALVAGVVSYMHMHDVALRAGEGPRSWLVPLAVDGLMVAASMTMFIRRRAGLPAGPLVWTSILVSAGASLVANIAAADPTILGRAVAAWPPVALLLAYEMLMSQVRPASDRHTAPAPVPARHADTVVPERDTVPPPAMARHRHATPGTSADRHAAQQRYRDSVAEGTPLTGAALATLFGRSDRWGRARIAEVRHTLTAPVVAPATMTAVA